jgi:hypothetical protein
MIHPDTEVRFINEEIGYGLFARDPIPSGTITWVRDPLDREISPEELSQYSPPTQEIILHYSYRNNIGNFIFCWDNTRYVNHSCTPNCCVTPYNLEIAIRDILAGEEITNHYGMLNIIEPFTLPPPSEVTIRPDDLLLYGNKWDNELQRAFPRLIEVRQPLQAYIAHDQWKMLTEISCGARQLQSISSCYYPEPSQKKTH